MNKFNRFWRWLLGYSITKTNTPYIPPIYMGPNFSCSCGASGKGKSEDHECLRKPDA